VALAMREQGISDNDLVARLAGDPRLGMSRSALEEAIASPLSFTGAAVEQVHEVVRRVESVASRYPDAASYSPGEIL
jgi:adenylosuccinate lyase